MSRDHGAPNAESPIDREDARAATQPDRRRPRRGFGGASRFGDHPRARFSTRAGERGAVAVETALMVPLLFFLFFGMVEFGLYWQADHTINEASRAGARLGATLARELDYQEDVVITVESSIADNIPSGEVSLLTIYRADPRTGDPISGTVENCTVNCYRYTWDPDDAEFDHVSGTAWAASDQAACGESGHNDYLGVYVEGSFNSVTGMFGGDRTIKESSVIRLEPVPLSSTCEP